MSYVVGAGCSRGCTAEELLELIDRMLTDAGAIRSQVVALATIDARRDEPALVEVAARTGWPLRTHAPASLAAVAVPTPSPLVAEHVGSPSVAEAAAVLSAGTGQLAVPKLRSPHATCALAQAG